MTVRVGGFSPAREGAPFLLSFYRLGCFHVYAMWGTYRVSLSMARRGTEMVGESQRAAAVALLVRAHLHGERAEGSGNAGDTRWLS